MSNTTPLAAGVTVSFEVVGNAKSNVLVGNDAAVRRHYAGHYTAGKKIYALAVATVNKEKGARKALAAYLDGHDVDAEIYGVGFDLPDTAGMTD